MPIALISALRHELHTALACIEGARCQRIAGRDFWQGRWHGHEVLAVLCGVGKVAAATTAAVLADRFQARALLLTGVAGGLAAGVRVGDAVVARAFLQHDLDASPLFPRYEVPFYGRAMFETDPRLSAALEAALARVLGRLPQVLGAQAVAEFDLHAARAHGGLIISGDRFIATRAASAALRQALPDALAVEMEGAAIAQVCHDWGLPLAGLRTVSDRADDQAHADFDRFVRAVASPYAAAVLDELFRAAPPGSLTNS